MYLNLDAHRLGFFHRLYSTGLEKNVDNFLGQVAGNIHNLTRIVCCGVFLREEVITISGT